MRLERLDLTAFGHFSGQTLDFGKAPVDASASPAAQTAGGARGGTGGADFHIVYGDNEAGKSTTLVAIVDLLFGMPNRTSWNFLHANDVLEIGARLWQPGHDGTQAIDVRRFKNRLLDAAGNRLNELLIDTHGLSRDAFKARFSLDDRVLEEGSEAILRQEGDLGAALFGASSGLADISARLDEAMETANTFWQPNKRVGIALPELCKELDDLKALRKERDLEAKDWKGLRKSLDLQRERCESAATSLKALEVGLKRHERDRIAIGRAMTLRDRRAHLETLPMPVTWPETRPRTASREIQQLAVADARIATTEKQRLDEHEKSARLTIDTSLLDARTSIDAVARQYNSLASQRSERPKLEEQQLSMEHRMRALTEQLTALPTSRQSASAITSETIDRLDQLAREYATLSADHQSAHKEARQAQDALANHTGAITDATSPIPSVDQTVSSADPTSLTDALHPPVMVQDDVQLTRLKAQLETITDAAPLTRLGESRDRLHALEQERDEAMEQLLPWQGTPQVLSTMNLPDRNALDSLDKRFAELAEQRRQTLARHREASTALKSLGERQQSDQDDGGVAAIDLDASRALRDRCFNAVHSAIASMQPHAELASLLSSLKAAMCGHDALIRQQIRNGDTSARIQQTAAQMSQERVRVEQLDGELLAIDQAQIACVEELDVCNIDVRLPAPTLATLNEWLRKRDQALESGRRARQANDEVQQRQDDVIACSAALADALFPCLDDAAGDSIREGMALPDLLSIGRETLKQLGARLDTSLREQTEHHRLTQDLQQRQRNASSTALALDDWQSRWQRTVASAGHEKDWGDVPAESFIDLLPTLRKFSECHRDLDQSQAALSVLDERVRQFEQNVLTLAKSLQTDSLSEFDLDDASTTLTGITRRLDEALKAQVESQRSENRQRALEEEIAILETQSEPLRRQVNEMMRLTDTQTGDALQESLEAMAKYDDVQSAIGELSKDLQTTLAPEALPAALERLNTLDATALDVDITHLGDQIAQARDQLAQSQQELMRLELNAEGVGDDDSVAELNETRENLLLDIEERARDALSLRLGKLAVESALKRYRDAHRSTMLKHARKAFTELTRGHYTDLRAQADNKGLERLIGIRSNGASLQAGQMSKGTRLQLFLALRIAAYHEYADQRTPLPFIADDILESSDDHRTQAAISQLHAMSRRGQVIYLTHHRHLVNIAREQCADEVTIHQLSSR